MTYHQFFNKNNTTGPISGAGTAFSFGAPEFTPGFSGVRITPFLIVKYILSIYVEDDNN
jgi:hypothetical protein